MKLDRWQRLRPLLDEALALAPACRGGFVDDLAGADAELRDDLKRMLAEHERIGSQTSPNALQLAAPAALESIHEDAELDRARVGQCIGAYRLTSLLGAGGMGAVYLAERHENGFTQIVALKVVRKALAGPAARERFERERRILASLKHPGIALLFDGGQTSEGLSFYTMEHVEGEPITEFCVRHALSVRQRVRLLLQVSATLSYAHQNLVVHRDIKPSNVLVTADRRVKLIDFGLAKLLDDHTIPTMTQTGLGPMTPAYAAPEQFQSGTAVVATDIYQFGVLCFLILTGHLPYRVDPKDNLRWARAVLEEEPMTLSRAAVLGEQRGSDGSHRGLRRSDLATDLDAIVRKCLAKVPEQRYRSADALIGDLEAFLSGRPVSARPAGPLYFAWRFVQRRRYAVAATALALVVLGAAALVAWQQSRAAQAQAERAAQEAQVRDVTRAMLTDLLRAGPGSAVSQRPRSALEALDQGTERTLSVLGSNLRHRALAVSVLAESYLELGHPQRARTLIEKTLPMLGSGESLQAEKLQLQLLLARASAELGDMPISKDTLAQAEATIDLLSLPPDAPSRLAAALVHVQIQRHEGQQEIARETTERLLRNADRPPLNQTLEFAGLLQADGLLAYDDTQAIAEFTRAWEITAAHYGLDSPAALAAQRYVILRDLNGPHRLDTVRMISGQEDQVRAAFGEQSLDYADVLSIHCELRSEAKDYAEASACWRKALAIYEQAPDAEQALAVTYENIAANLLKLGKPAEALPFYERELAARSKNFAPGNQNVIHSRLQIAKTRCLIGDIDRATGEFDLAIDDYVRSVGPLHPWEAVYAAYFSTCLLDAHRIESARSIMEKHGRLDPPRRNMTDEDRVDVQKVWDRLAASR